ncbi:hypothetical protein E2C01_079429 [Portunus trituberculatus]|uniref:Uncharacterized protein n=1 Tax=Portunus trituberculatus TaxID=210409 RepID=A0A5B7IWW1_PORTR|nr:hypothetical protein [Portunus trituberculatus]
MLKGNVKIAEGRNQYCVLTASTPSPLATPPLNPPRPAPPGTPHYCCRGHIPPRAWVKEEQEQIFT